MKRKTSMLRWTVLFLAAWGGIAVATDDYPIKVYPCIEAPGPVKVDGALGDPAWNGALSVSEFTFYNKPDPAPIQTSFRVIYDDQYLYFGVICLEPLMSAVGHAVWARDETALFGGEVVEFFVEPQHDHTNYFQIAVNPDGSVYDARGTDSNWNATGLQVKTKRDSAQWTIEMAFPWKDLGISPKAGMALGFDVCRDRNVGKDKEWTLWAYTGGGFHGKDCYAHLVLSATPEQLGRMGAIFRQGDRQGPVMISGTGEPVKTAYRALVQEALAKLEAQLAEQEKANTQEKDAPAQHMIETVLKQYREEMAAMRSHLEADRETDLRPWASQAEMRIQRLRRELIPSLWNVRLAALLNDL